MSIEQAILDRFEQRSAQIAQLQSTVHALERAADSQREHAMMERGRLLEENKKLAASLEAASSEAKKERAMYVDEQRRANGLDRQLAAACDDSYRKDREIGALKNESGELLTHSFKLGRNNGENVKQFLDRICAEVPLESTREGLKNAVAKLQEVNAQLDSAKGEAEEWLKQCHAARRQRDEVKEEARKETQRLSDVCAELQGKHESLLAKITDLGSYAMTLGRKEGEPLEMFMERQALRLAALEAAITAAKCDELAKATARIKPLEALYKTLKGWQENDHIIGYGLTIDTAINKATEALSQLTA